MGLQQGDDCFLRVRDVLTDNQFLFFTRRVADYHLQEETVNLGFRERVGAFLFDGVLGGHYKERFVEREGVVADCDLAFLHSLEECGLHFGRGAVDFIGQYEIGENRAFLYLELLVFNAVYHCSEHVGREKVGRELDSAVFCVDKLCKCFYCQRFGQTGHTFEKDVAVGEECYKE